MDSALLDQACDEFLSQWKRLVSTTNWEKGRIISQWRAALISADAPNDEYSDDAWSRRVGNVTPQHVGRLRRTYDRFGDVHEDYDGLFWSHFQAALDWHDAEMWLEGAVQNQWSISEMRRARLEVVGDGIETASGDLQASDPEWDEDAEETANTPATLVFGEPVEVHETGGARGQSSTSQRQRASSRAERSDEADSMHESIEESQQRAPFAELPSLPSDVTEAFEAFKLCILRHKLAGFEEIAREDLAATLDALKELLYAPAA